MKSQVKKREQIPSAQARTRDNGLRFRARLLDKVTAITGALAFIAGIATDWLRQFGASWFSRRDIRKAVQAEVDGLVVILNFYILRAIENPKDDTRAARYFSDPLQLLSVTYYWQERRDQLLRLPEWPRLVNVNETLAGLGRGPDPTLFTAIMLFQQFLIPPLDKCISRRSRKLARRVLDRDDVASYQTDYLLRKSGFKKD